MVRKPQKHILEKFWEDYALYGQRRWDMPSPRGKEEVLKRLITLSRYVCDYPDKIIHRKNRQNFDSLKKTHKWEYCFACGGNAQIRHHIILIKHGGSNSGKNIVRLCKECHAEIHPWLKNPGF